MTTGTGDGLMRLLRQIADDLDELRGEERRHVSAIERTSKRVRAIETLFNGVNKAQQATGVLNLDGVEKGIKVRSPPLNTGPAADVQLLPPARPCDVDIPAAAQTLVWHGVPATLAKTSIEALLSDDNHVVDVHVPHVGIEAQFVAEMAATGIGVAFSERRVAYPLVAERRELLAVPG